MRRFLSVMAVLVLLLSLSVSAFAASTISSQYVQSTVPELQEGGAVNEAGEAVNVTVSEFKPSEAGQTIDEAAQGALEAAQQAGEVTAGEVAAAEVFDIDMTDGTQPDGTISVTLVRENTTGEVAAVMYYDEANGEWDSADFSVNPDGSITIKFEHFCTVVIMTKAPEQAPDVKPTPAPGGTTGGTTGGTIGSSGSGSGSPTSPKTGFDASAWIIAMAGLTLCAAFCFVRAGKKSN